MLGSFSEKIRCLHCDQEFLPNDKTIAVFLFAQTTGMKPRQKSSAEKISFCSTCAVSLAMGTAPVGALNLAAYQILRNLVAADPALTDVAYTKLRKTAALLVELNSQLQVQQIG